MGVTKARGLSSLDIPLTDDTRKRLKAIGVPDSTIRGLSEMGGQGILALRDHEEGDEDDKPICFRSKYDPTSALCQGCIVSVSCWRGDRDYLDALKSGLSDPPPGVPEEVVTERMKIVTSRPVAPPPPKKKGKRRGKKKSRGNRRRTR